jgi:hypothetical protein
MMKKIIFYLLVTTLFFNCSDSDSDCSVVENRAIDFGTPNEYRIKIDGSWTPVSQEDYLKFKVGSTYCY